MRWNSQVIFSRPIRWILALHGNVVVPFHYAGVLSRNFSCGLRNISSPLLKVETAESFFDVLRRNGICVDIEERKRRIIQHSKALVKTFHGNIIFESSLLDEVANLVEMPVPVLGKFNESFLGLPKELLIMVMQKHQKYFPLIDDNGGLLPCFIAVANGSINTTVVTIGNEAVLRARYEDAKFFYDMDISKNFSKFRYELKEIIFHERLGTMLDKMTRVQNFVTELSISLGFSGETLQIVQDAASLAMSDLATAVVTEFTALSGTMARHYALKSGYSMEIAEALFEITLPRFSGDILPVTDAGMVLAIADRLDSLVGLFSAGCQPSSSNDQFGLRRISFGLVQLLVERNISMDIRHALGLAAAVQPIKVDSSMIGDVHVFITRRLENFLIEKGINPQVVRSVLAERSDWPSLATKSAYKMEALTRGDLLPKVVKAYSRPSRILYGKDVKADMEVDEAAFETSAEKYLWRTFLSVKNKCYPGIEVDEFVEVSSELFQPLEDFFNSVFVMVDDERIRQNRLLLLKNISQLPTGIADFSLLPGF